MKNDRKRQDLYKAIQFLQDNPWLQVLGALVLVDLLRYLGIISKSKSSDMGVIIAGLGIGMNGGGVAGTALAALIGGSFEFFPNKPLMDPLETTPGQQKWIPFVQRPAPPAGVSPSWWDKFLTDRWPWEN